MDTSSSDYPGDVSTTGVIGIGRTDYGVIDRVGDVDWFRVSLKAGQTYKFEIEAGSINGLFDPQLSVHGMSGELVIRATVGQGFQSKHVELTPTAAGDNTNDATNSNTKTVFKNFIFFSFFDLCSN